jgi:hypothetical protein
MEQRPAQAGACKPLHFMVTNSAVPATIGRPQTAPDKGFND